MDTRDTAPRERRLEQDRKLEEQAAALEWIRQGCGQLFAQVVALEQQERLERQERQERNMALAARLTALEERLEAGLATLLEVATAVSL